MGDNALPLLARLPLPELTTGFTRPATVYFSFLDAFFVQYSFAIATALHPILLASSVFLVGVLKGVALVGALSSFPHSPAQTPSPSSCARPPRTAELVPYRAQSPSALRESGPRRRPRVLRGCWLCACALTSAPSSRRSSLHMRG
ncbi:hypothetical protein DFH11DRAFT_1234660 [Phellopilus nigrolimitatus]|nr:hypothetical protein DFH11DRAFT_1234660 [Phellopilus nigrolimitatus]